MSDNLKSSPETVAAFTLSKRTVMLVEDSEIDRAVYQRYLRTDTRHDYTFVEVATGREALDSYQQHQPDIILLDYLLPDMDGLEWLSQWQQQYNSLCSVIILTGQGDEGIAVQFIKMGAADYFVKGQITQDKLRLSVNREIALQDLKREKQGFTETIKLQSKDLEETNKLLQTKVNQCEISQQLIRSSEKKLRLALDHAPIPIIVHAEDGEVLQISQTWTELSGYTHEDIPTTDDWIAKAYTEEQETVRLAIANLYQLEHRVDEGEFKIITASGQTRIWDFSSAPLGRLINGKRIVITTAKDVTETKQAEIALKLTQNRFRNTFEQAAVGIAHLAPDGKWLRVNQKLCQIVGYTKQELLSKTLQDITHPDDLIKDRKFINQILAGEIQTYAIEKRYIHSSKNYIWVNLTVSLVRNSDGEPDYLISVIEDISDRKELEISLQRSLRRLSNLHKIDRAILAAEKPQAIAQAVIDDIYSFLPCQRISFVAFDWEQEQASILATKHQDKNLTTTGYQVGLEIWQDLIAQLQDSDQHQDYIVACLSQFPQLSQAVITKGKTKLDCFLGFPLRSRGNLLGILKIWVEDAEVITTDEFTTVGEICSQIAIALQQARLYKQSQQYASQLEARVSERTAQLEEINRELKTFTYSISHDLKAPLRAIQGFALALEEDYAENLDSLGREYTSRLVSNAQQMTQLIEDLLVYSRLSRTEIQLQPTELTALVNRAIEELKPEIELIQAKITVDVPLLPIMGNKTILLQVISNLLSNAIKFVPSQPRIRIWTEVVPSDTANSEANWVRFWIEDNGIGISRQHQERIFNVFERLHSSEIYEGTGIGLAIVKKGMERLGGKFGVESEPNQGSRFWIEGSEA